MNILTQYRLRIPMQGAFLRKDETCFSHEFDFPAGARLIVTVLAIAVFRVTWDAAVLVLIPTGPT
jgi:hypothetical protein